jgi:hypothetical protein
MLNALNQSRSSIPAGISSNHGETVRNEKQIPARTTLPMLDWPSNLFSVPAMAANDDFDITDLCS